MNFIKYDDNFYFDTDEGVLVHNLTVFSRLKNILLKSKDFKISPTLQYDIQVQPKSIEIGLFNNTTRVESREGFLIQVYLSGSNGQLTRLLEQPVVDVDSGTEKSESFTNYMEIEID